MSSKIKSYLSVKKIRNAITYHIHYVYVYCTQVLTGVYVIPVSFFFIKIQVQRPENLHIHKGTLIISNHQSKSDPFFIMYSMKWGEIFSNIPCYFPVTPNYMRSTKHGWVLKQLNCYDVGETTTERMRALFKTRDIIRKKNTLILFPEGHINRVNDDVKDFFGGIDILMREEIPIIMVRLRGFNVWSFERKRAPVSVRFEELPSSYTAEQKREAIKKFYA